MSDFRDIVELIHSTQDKALLEDFLLGITTPKEREELIMRVQIVDMLLDGAPQRAVSEKLGVGIATVTRASKELSQDRFKVLRLKHEKR
jgi:TrpR family trp operon transcriptional repressor